MPAPAKGKVTKIEADFIKVHADTMGIYEVAKRLGRRPELIKEYCEREGILYNEDPGELIIDSSIDVRLRNSREWQIIREEFTAEELEYFAHCYSKYMRQFEEGLLPSEEAQIFQLIKYEILMHRNLKSSKKLEVDIKRVEDYLKRLYNDFDAEDEKGRNELVRMEEVLSSSRSAYNAKTTEYNKLQEKNSALMKELKATRDQRISKIEASGRTFIHLIKEVQARKFRETEGKEMGLINLAAEKERSRLSEYHEYEDGTIDRPLLNSDSILGDDDIEVKDDEDE